MSSSIRARAELVGAFVMQNIHRIAAHKFDLSRKDDMVWEKIKAMELPASVFMLHRPKSPNSYDVNVSYRFRLRAGSERNREDLLKVVLMCLLAIRLLKADDLAVSIYGQDEKGWTFIPGAGIDDVEVYELLFCTPLTSPLEAPSGD